MHSWHFDSNMNHAKIEHLCRTFARCGHLSQINVYSYVDANDRLLKFVIDNNLPIVTFDCSRTKANLRWDPDTFAFDEDSQLTKATIAMLQTRFPEASISIDDVFAEQLS